MRENQALQFGDHRVVLAEGKVSVNAVIQRDQPKLLQPRRLAVRELRLAQVIEHRSAPHGQRLSELSGSVLGVTEPQRLPAPLQQLLELGGINLVGTNKQAIPGL